MANLKLRKKYYTGLQIIDAVKDLHLSYDDSLKLYGNLASISTDDVAPVVHGKWIQHYVGQERTPWGSDCSVCGEWLVIDRLVMQEKYHYCPNCGAKMDGGAK